MDNENSRMEFLLRDRVTRELIRFYIASANINVGTEENYLSLADRLEQLAQAIRDASQSYTPPAGGIPQDQLSPEVQALLALAGTSLQDADDTLDTESDNPIMNRVVAAAIAQMQRAIDALTNTEDTTKIINSMVEVTAFLNGITTDETLTGKLYALQQQIDAKQAAISDLETIRSGAQKGASSVQKVKVGEGGTPLEPTNGIITLPEVEAPEQEQADWNENDSSKPGYIKNRPDIPGRTSDLTKDDVYTRLDVDALIAGVEAGKTVVVNSEGANIIDEHNNNSVLFAPSARQMKLAYTNINALQEKLDALIDDLAGIAFLGAKTTPIGSLDWAGEINTYTLIKGAMTNISKVEIGSTEMTGQTATVNEGGITVKLTPTSAGYTIADADISIICNGSSVPFTSVENEGVIEVTFAMRGNTTIAAIARNGIEVHLDNMTNVSKDKNSVAVGAGEIITLSKPAHYHWSGNGASDIVVTYGTTNITSSCTIAESGETITIELPSSVDDPTKVIVISGVTASENGYVLVDLDNVGSDVSVMVGTDELTDGQKLYNSEGAIVVAITPNTGFKFTAAPSATIGSSSATMIGSGIYGTYTFEIGTSVANGTTVAITASVEAATAKTITIPSGTGIKVEDLQGETLTGDQTAYEGSTFACVIRCLNGYGFATGYEPACTGATVTQQSDGSYKVQISPVSEDATVTATAEAITAITAGGLNYGIITADTTTVGVAAKSGSGDSSNSGDKYTGDIVVPASVSYHGATYSVVQVNYAAFQNCPSLTSVSLPEGITKIAGKAFAGSYNVAAVNFPSTVTSIDWAAFACCRSIVEFDFSSCSNLSIGSSVFHMDYSGIANGGVSNKCTSMKFKDGGRVTFVSGAANIFVSMTALTSLILNATFSYPLYEVILWSGCTELASVTFGKDYAGQGTWALPYKMFNNCKKIRNVYVYKNTPLSCNWTDGGNSPFHADSVNAATLHIPTTATLSDWTSHAVWGKFSSIVQDLTIE